MGLMKKLTSAIVASSLVFSLAGSAFAAYTPAAGETAGNRMMGLQILKGKYENDKLALKDEITRAELVTIIVRAFGKEADAALLNGAAAFPDTASHWASGNIAMAKALVEKAGGDAIGMPDGSFNPDGKLTPAQAVAFLMKFLGVKADAAKPWPANFLDKAVELNLITAEDNALIAPMLNDNATRGLVFYVFDRAFYNYDLGAGKTFYTKYVDPTAPMVTLNAVEPTTLDSKVTITGKVEGATEAYVGTKSVTLDANGNFSVDYELPELKEYSIAVTARDLAGNAAEKAVVVTRTTGNAAAIEAAAITVAAGQTVDVAAIVKDAKGNALNGVTVTGESTVGSFEAGKFTAGKTAGTGTLTLKAGEATANVNVTVTAGALATVVPSTTSAAVGAQVTLSAQDEYGNAISGVTYTNDSANAVVVGEKFVGSKAGNYTITGSKDGKTATATVGVYSSTVKKVVVTAPATVVGNTAVDNAGAVTVKGSKYQVTVKAVDTNGNVVANYEGDLTLNLPDGFVIAEDSNTKGTKTGVATFDVYAVEGKVGYQLDLTGKTTIGEDVIGDEGESDETTSDYTAASVEVTEQVATGVKFDTTDTGKYIRSNDGDNMTSVSFYLVDQNGKRFLDTTVAYPVKFTVTGAATIGMADTAEHKTSIDTTYNGTKLSVNFESIKGKTGDATLTAAVEGLGTATASVTAAVAGDADKVSVSADMTEAVANYVADESGDLVTYTVQVTDANGVPVTGEFDLTGTLNFEDDNDIDVAVNGTAATLNVGDEETTFPITTDEETGKATIEISSSTFVGDLKLSVKNDDLTEASVQVAFKADVPSQVKLTRTTEIKIGTTTPTATLTAQLLDGAGNVAKVAGKSVTFAADKVKFNGTADELTVTTDSEGKATVTATVPTYVDKDYVVTITGDADEKITAVAGKDTVTLHTSDLVATKLTYTLAVEGQTVVRPIAGQEVTVTVTAKDANGEKISGDNLYFVPAAKAYTDASAATKIGTTLDTSAATVQKFEDNGDGTYTFTFVPAATGTFAFTVVDNSAATKLEQAGSVRVAADVASKFIINGGDDIEVTRNAASSAITLKLTDKFGNAVGAPSKLTINVTDASGDAYSAIGIRTSAASANVTSLSLSAGQSSTTFYVLTSLAKDTTYEVNFTATWTDAAGTVHTYEGTANVVVK
ncbi:MAG TPA: filamin/ABP280 repeat domain-containing protein [Symbiobacteriaceae bacterium]|nr:filamin/ABP280 repeat domain-containing protein [Symbiobacteriaceae bacterium]